MWWLFRRQSLFWSLYPGIGWLWLIFWTTVQPRPMHQPREWINKWRGLFWMFLVHLFFSYLNYFASDRLSLKFNSKRNRGLCHANFQSTYVCVTCFSITWSIQALRISLARAVYKVQSRSQTCRSVLNASFPFYSFSSDFLQWLKGEMI